MKESLPHTKLTQEPDCDSFFRSQPFDPDIMQPDKYRGRIDKKIYYGLIADNFFIRERLNNKKEPPLMCP